MTFKAAQTQCRKVGTSHATGDALRSMYAELVGLNHGGSPAMYYGWLQRNATGDDTQIAEASRNLIRNRSVAYDALMGIDLAPA